MIETTGEFDAETERQANMGGCWVRECVIAGETPYLRPRFMCLAPLRRSGRISRCVNARPDTVPELQRLLDLVVFGRGLDQENEYRARSRWNRFIANVKQRLAAEEANLADIDDLRSIVGELLDIVGHDAVVGLSSDYAQGDYLQQQIDATINRAHALLSDGEDPATALASFSGDRAVRIMSIHKSKGLEFDTVVVLGVETQTFWGAQDAERSAFFVGISRAKRRLYLTVCDRRVEPKGAKYWKVARTEHDEFLGYATPYL